MVEEIWLFVCVLCKWILTSNLSYIKHVSYRPGMSYGVFWFLGKVKFLLHKVNHYEKTNSETFGVLAMLNSHELKKKLPVCEASRFTSLLFYAVHA